MNFLLKSITALLIIFPISDIRASDYLYEIGKVHHLIKMNYPIKNFNQFPWNEQLCDLVKESNFGKISKDELIDFLNTKYSYLEGDISFSKQLNTNMSAKQKSIYVYKHIGIGFDNYLPRKGKKSYKTTIVNLKPETAGVTPYKTYQIADGVFLNIRLSDKLKLAKYTPNTIISEKEFNLDRKETRAASLLKCYFIHSILLSEEQMEERKPLLNELLEQNSTIVKERDFIDLMRRLVASFNDGHGFYNSTKKIAPLVYSFVSQYYPKVEFKKQQDQIFVSALDSSLSQTLQSGDIVVSVNNIDALTYLESQKVFYSGATDAHKTSKTMEDFISTWTKDSTFTIVVKRNNNLIETKLLCSENRSFTRPKVESLPLFEKIDAKTHFINLSDRNFTYKNFVKNLESIKTSERIVFNLIGYPPYEIYKVFGHFIDSSISTPDYKSQVSYSNSSYKEWINEPWSIEPHREKVLGKKLYFLMGDNMSWPETLLEMVKTYKLGTTIGQPTYDSNGDMTFVKLPSGSFTLTGLKVERNGINPYSITPDINVELSEIDSLEKIVDVIDNIK